MIDRLEALFHPEARKKLGGRDQAAIPLRVSGSRRARLTICGYPNMKGWL